MSDATTKTNDAKAPDKETEAKAEKKPGRKAATGEQYLYALFLRADWITEEYRSLAAPVEKQTEVLKELYMCACDGIPADKAEESLKHSPPEQALKALRLKRLEEEALCSCTGNLDSLAKKTERLEQEMENVAQTISQLAVHVPKMPDLFPEDKKKEDAKREVKTEEKAKPEKNVPKSGTHKADFSGKMKSLITSRKKENIASYIDRMAVQGYNNDQLNFIIDCFEEGLTKKQIEKIIAPKLPVELMRRLRDMERKKEEKKNG